VASGGFDPTLATDEDFERAKGVRILIAHGKQDAVVPFTSGKKLAEALAERGVAHEFLPFEGGHTLPQEMREKVSEWIRNGTPREEDGDGK
jgi:phospholipase/carboxylesterase